MNAPEEKNFLSGFNHNFNLYNSTMLFLHHNTMAKITMHDNGNAGKVDQMQQTVRKIYEKTPFAFA